MQHFPLPDNALHERGYYKVWNINIGACPRLEFDNFSLINCQGYNFIFMVHLSFYAVPLLISDIMYDDTTTP